MIDIITPVGLSLSLNQIGLVVAPLTFSVQIFSLLVLLSLFIFVPVSLIGTLGRLAGLKSGIESRGARLKAIASRFLVYLLYHLAMFGFWFIVANILIGGLYSQKPTYDYGASPSGASRQGEGDVSRLYQSDNSQGSPTDERQVDVIQSQPNKPVAGQVEMLPPEDRPIEPPNNALRVPVPDGGKVPPEEGLAYRENTLSSDPYPPYDPVYTKSDILAATYLLILIYPLLFAAYIVLWTILSTNAAYLFRRSKGQNPFPPSIGVYARLSLWNVILFLSVAVIVRSLALY